MNVQYNFWKLIKYLTMDYWTGLDILVNIYS